MQKTKILHEAKKKYSFVSSAPGDEKNLNRAAAKYIFLQHRIIQNNFTSPVPCFRYLTGMFEGDSDVEKPPVSNTCSNK